MFTFSIVLPVKNGGHFVKECVKSILEQTYSFFNLIILDNCSTDGTLEWIDSLGSERVVIYRSDKSLTIEQNWNRIKDFPKNEFMTMIGHDDIMESNYLFEMNQLILKHSTAKLFQTHYKYIDKDGLVKRSCLPMDEVQTAYEFLACQMNNTIESTGTGYMMRSADFDRLGGIPTHYPNLIFADYELWIQLSRQSYKATCPKECFRYREHASVSKATNGMLYFTAFEHYVLFLKSLKNDFNFNSVIERYGNKMLLYYCQSLSHRLLKTPLKYRSIMVNTLIYEFNQYASMLIPGQSFEPLKMPKTRLAMELDRSFLGRGFFSVYKKISAI